MILTDREIEIALSRKKIIISPMPDLKESLSSTTLDLTLSNQFVKWNALPGTSISPGAHDYTYTRMQPLQNKIISERYVLDPQSFVLAWTVEEVALPLDACIAARVEGKSSLARLGVGVHVTAPTIHSGFQGQIQLEVFNFGPYKIDLTPGMRVCQLIFEQTYGTPIKGYKRMFSGQTEKGFK